MVVAIRRNWDQNQGVVGSTTMKFTIQRNGTITGPPGREIERVRRARQRAMRAVSYHALPPLPEAFQNPTLTVHLRFEYLSGEHE